MTTDAYDAGHSQWRALISRARMLTVIDKATANLRHHRIARTYRTHEAADALVVQLNEVWQRERFKARAHIRSPQPSEVHRDELTTLLERPRLERVRLERPLLERPWRDVPCQHIAALSGYLSAFSTRDYPAGPRELSTILLKARELLTYPTFPLEIATRAQQLEWSGRLGEDALGQLGIGSNVLLGMSIAHDQHSDCFIGVSAPPPSEQLQPRRYSPEKLRVWVLPDDPADAHHVGSMANLALRAGEQPGVRSILVVPRGTRTMADVQHRARVAELITHSSQNADYYAKPRYEPGAPSTPPVALVTGDKWQTRIPDLVETLRGERRPNLRAKPGLQALRVVPTATANDMDGIEYVLRELQQLAGQTRRRQRLKRGIQTAQDVVRAAGDFAVGNRTVFDAAGRRLNTYRMKRRDPR